MQLNRIHIAQFCKFHEAIEIQDLAPGLNLFVGPNEAGKSTIASAIRAAFFERYRSSAVEHFRPITDSQASPAITLEFTVAGTRYKLFKQFLSKSRCVLEFGAQRLDASDAEDYLAELLGYQYAKRGRSQAEYWGIPGLLWVEQGWTQDVDVAIANALTHLRAALGAADQGQETSQIVQLVAQQRNALLTPSSGKPRDIYAKALQDLAQLSAERQDVEQAVSHYRKQVDRLADVRAAYHAADTEQPWQAFRRQEQAAQTQLDAVRQWEAQLQKHQQDQQQLQETIALYQSQLQHLADQTKTVAQRRSAVEDARHAGQSAKTDADHAQQQYETANAALTRAQQILEQCRQRDQDLSLQQQYQALTQQLQDSQQRLTQAQDTHQTLQDLQKKLAGVQLAPEDLSALDTLARQRDALRIRQQAYATRLQFTLEPQASLTLDDEILQGTGERQLSDQAILHVPGVGTLQIQPGGEDLTSLRQKSASVEAAWTALLRKMNAPSYEAVQTRHLQATALRAQCAQQEQALGIHAPQGIDTLSRTMAALQAQLAQFAAQQDGLQMSLGQIAPVAHINTADAQAAYQTAQTAAHAARERHQQAQLAVHTAQTTQAHALRELQAAQAAIDATQHQQRTQEIQARLVNANAQWAQHQAQIKNLQAQLTQIRADILTQDVARYQRSAEQSWQEQQQRHETLLRLDAELHTLGAQGLDERCAALVQAEAQAQQRVEELARRAQALDHLFTLLREHERRTTQALQQPLQRHLQHYLDLLFPGAQLGLNEHLSPDTLQRVDTQGARQELLQALSQGAREQLGLLGRLACADLLREAGRPTLLILDDALVHTDASRLTQMKRMLFDAATRHQVLLFSCHDTWWRDMGVAARDVRELAVDSAEGASPNPALF